MVMLNAVTSNTAVAISVPCNPMAMASTIPRPWADTPVPRAASNQLLT